MRVLNCLKIKMKIMLGNEYDIQGNARFYKMTYIIIKIDIIMIGINITVAMGIQVGIAIMITTTTIIVVVCCIIV